MLLFFASVTQGEITLLHRPATGRQYETLTFRFKKNLHFANPFDLVSNRVELKILDPGGTPETLSFFYDGLSTDSVEQWEARFTPERAGMYHMDVLLNGEVQSAFDVSIAPNREKKKGGLRLSGDLRKFAYATGEPFRGIGINVCWTDDYEYYFRKMRACGMNTTRIWMCPWNLSFEWQETGLGRYNLQSARRLDSILALAERYGIFVILCMDYHGVARKGWGYFKENRWTASPYNHANGGPCLTAADLFTNAEAKEYSRRKYLYIVSRFGHSPQILAWEFYNETDLMAGKTMPVNRWHVEMAEFVHAVDVHRHLVSTSSTRSFPEKAIDAFKDPSLDFVMYHEYNNVNFAPYIVEFHEATTEYYRKPVVLAEFGVEFRGADLTYKADSLHVGLHNGIWAGWFSETPVVPLSWWWDNYIDPHNLWYEYANLTRFADSLDLSSGRLAFATLVPGVLTASPQEQARSMVRCMYVADGCALWLKNEEYQWSIVQQGGALPPIAAFSQPVPDLAPGRYRILWYDPQTGRFAPETGDGEVKEDGILLLPVPAFARDLACLVKKMS
jgi:hypothetical protein